MTAHSAAHLTKEELTDNLLGVQSLTVNAHLLSCPACADEVQRMKSSIEGFRNAANAWSEDALVPARRIEQTQTVRQRLWPAPWVLAMAAMILLAVGSLTYFRQSQSAGQPTSAEVSIPVSGALSKAQLDQDNQLLSQVSGELSEAVPAPMQPLLVSESSSTSAVANK